MWRIAVSIGLVFVAIAWSAIAMVVIFLVVPSLWESVFGKTGGALAAMGALALAIWSAGRIMRLADRLMGEGDRSAAPARRLAAAEADVITDWQAYSDDIVRNKRWAFYRRTHQYDRLRELEEQRRRDAEAKAQAVSAVGSVDAVQAKA
jgi:hypothetical protein